MKNSFFVTLLLICLILPCHASSDEYEGLFKMGFMADNEEVENSKEGEIIFTPKEKEKIDLNSDDVISIEGDPVKLNIEKIEFLNPYRKTFAEPSGRLELFKTEKFTLFSDGKKELSDYMTDNFKSTMNVSYDFNKTITLRAGHEVWYVNPNASVGAKKFYFNPRINLTNRCYLDYISKYNQTSKNIEQEIGLNYRPKFFKEAASFGVKASTTINNETNELQSGKLKFSSDFYIY